jgi:hypothetical protein
MINRRLLVQSKWCKTKPGIEPGSLDTSRKDIYTFNITSLYPSSGRFRSMGIVGCLVHCFKKNSEVVKLQKRALRNM